MNYSGDPPSPWQTAIELGLTKQSSSWSYTAQDDKNMPFYFLYFFHPVFYQFLLFNTKTQMCDQSSLLECLLSTRVTGLALEAGAGARQKTRLRLYLGT